MRRSLGIASCFEHRRSSLFLETSEGRAGTTALVGSKVSTVRLHAVRGASGRSHTSQMGLLGWLQKPRTPVPTPTYGGASCCKTQFGCRPGVASSPL